MDRGRIRRAFTLIEILVVVAIVGLLAGLTLPAVQSARESARRADCSNRLRQIGLGLGGHQAARSTFPPGLWVGAAGSTGTIRGGPISPQCHLLPFLEQGALFDQLNIDLTFPATNPANQTVAATVLAAFLCPSDGPVPTGGTSYRACVGAHPYEFDSSPDGAGSFPNFDPLRPADFVDGLSQTVGFSERVRGTGAGRRFDRFRDVWYSHIYSLGGPRDAAEMLASCEALASGSPEVDLEVGHSWIIGRLEDTLYNHVAPPNWSGMDCGAEGAPGSTNALSTIGAFSARAFHPGGVQVLLMDGSTHFVRATIALPAWRAMASRSGGDSWDGSSF